MAVKLVVVLVILVRFVIKFELVADCHLVIVPVCPDKVKVVLFVPVQTAVLPLMLPPTETASTVTVPVELFAEAHEPLLTTAL